MTLLTSSSICSEKHKINLVNLTMYHKLCGVHVTLFLHTIVLVKWFNIDIEVGRQKFSEAMSGLKLFSEDGAHPTNYHDEPLTLDTARQLVVAKAQFPKEIATEMREVAVRYVDMLGQIRAENHQISFFYNETM